MTLESRIEKKLNEAFQPAELIVENESHHHAGHAGHSASGDSHWRIKITAAAFAGKSRVERQRMVNAALAEEIAGGIHALAMTVKAPGE